MKPALLVPLIALAILPRSVRAQDSRKYDVQLDAGFVAQEAHPNLRSGTGVSASFDALRRLPHRLSAGASLSVANFPAPDAFVSPGGCLGATPCVIPSPSVVRTTMLGAIASYATPASDEDVAPFVLAGFGMRRLTESPQRGADARPYVEIGLGATLFERGIVRIRYQATRPGSELPKWSMPVTIGWRF